MRPTRARALLLPLLLGVAGCGGGDDGARPGGTTAPPTTAGAAAPGEAVGTPVDWLATVCPEGGYQGIEVFPGGRGGPDALIEGWSCTRVPQDGSVTYRSVELFTYADDPTAYWQAQADRSADSHVYFAVGRTDTGWAAFVEDDSRHPVADPVIAAAAEVGFALHLDG